MTLYIVVVKQIHSWIPYKTQSPAGTPTEAGNTVSTSSMADHPAGLDRETTSYNPMAS